MISNSLEMFWVLQKPNMFGLKCFSPWPLNSGAVQGKFNLRVWNSFTLNSPLCGFSESYKSLGPIFFLSTEKVNCAQSK